MSSAWPEGSGRIVAPAPRPRAQPLGQPRRALQRRPKPDRAREPRGSGADDQHADLDLGHARSDDELAGVERRRVVRRFHAALRARTSSVSFGTISCRSPTTPRSAYSKIGAFGSLLIATISPEPCIPTLCWIAPEMPTATYNFGETVFPVCPTCAA